MYHFLQKLLSSLRPSSTNANLLQRVPPFIFYLFYVTYKTGRLQRVPPFNFFFGTVRIFFSKIFNVSKDSPLRIFWYFATESMLMNPKGSPLFIFRHCATFSKFFQEKNFQNFFCFQSSREKWFSSHIEHERHTLGVSKVFSKLFMNTSWAYLENCAFWDLDIAPTLDVPVLFLVGAFSFKEKSPTITVASFFFFFFVRPQSSSRMYHFLQKLLSSLRLSSTNANLLQRVPPFVFYLFYVTYKTGRLQRVPPFIFRHYATFSKFFSKKKFQKNFQNFFPVEKSDFPVISSMKGTLWVSRKCFQSISWIHPGHIQKTLSFLSLRYSADFRRSRLVLFFSSDYNLTLIGPLFLQSKLLKLLA